MVIMGTRGHRKIDDMMPGTVARKVVRKSTVPVLTVRLADERQPTPQNRYPSVS
jgi:nucleotide-binding universal stress UspA family protein